jgi:hypothetical protein
LVLTSILAVLPPGRAPALTVRSAPLEVLAEEASVILHGEVVSTVAEPAPGEPYALRTRVVVRAFEVSKGEFKPSFDFVVPGGETAELATMAPGVPRFVPGDQVVLLLEEHRGDLLPVGYSLGTFWVDADGSLWQQADPGRWLDPLTDDLVASWLGSW